MIDVLVFHHNLLLSFSQMVPSFICSVVVTLNCSLVRNVTSKGNFSAGFHYVSALSSPTAQRESQTKPQLLVSDNY